MSVGSQVNDALKKLQAGHFEDAIIAASVALSATARLESPNRGDKDACRLFLQNNLAVISKIAWFRFGVAHPINFRYRSLDQRSPGITVRSMPEMLYDVVRCTALHEAVLPENLRFTNQPVIQLGNDGQLLLSIDVIYGMLIAIVGSPMNRNQRADGDPDFSFGGKTVKLNKLWGDLDQVSTFIGTDSIQADGSVHNASDEEGT